MNYFNLINDNPKNWNLKRVKEIAKWKIGFTPDSNNDFFYSGDDVWVTIGDMNDKYIKDSKRKINGILFNKKNKIPENSLLFSFKLSIGQVAFNNEPIFTNEAICSFLKKSKINLNYFYYSAPIFIVKNSKKNIYNADLLNQNLIANSVCLYPPIKEQIKISNFLDKNCEKIEKEISLLERKSQLLEEYKQSLIFETVTKGLDKNAEMKESGIDWIGEIPKHWNVKRIKNIYKLGMGSIILKEDLIEEGKYPVYSATAEDKFFGKVNKINILLKKGDLVIPARGNSIGFVKKINIEEFCTCTQTTIYAKNRSKEYTDYYYYYLLGNKKNIFSYDNTAIPQITVSQINGKNLLVPPIVEQEKISIFLNEKIFSINENIGLINKKVELLKEYKQSLIYEAVTGQLDIE